MKRRKSKWTLKDLCIQYRKIREEHGDFAKSSKWMSKNGYGWLYYQIKNHDLSWNEFKKEAGFNENILQRPNYCLGDLYSEYRAIRKEHGDKAKRSVWVRKNGYNGMYEQIVKYHRLTWDEFKKQAGFDDEPFSKKRMKLEELIKIYQDIRKEHGDKARKSEWVYENKYQWLYRQVLTQHNLKWDEFKKQAGFDDEPLKRKKIPFKELRVKYIAIRKEHGDEAKSSKWMRKNKYGWIVGQVERSDTSWPNFIKLCEGHFSVDREDLMI